MCVSSYSYWIFPTSTIGTPLYPPSSSPSNSALLRSARSLAEHVYSCSLLDTGYSILLFAVLLIRRQISKMSQTGKTINWTAPRALAWGGLTSHYLYVVQQPKIFEPTLPSVGTLSTMRNIARRTQDILQCLLLGAVLKHLLRSNEVLKRATRASAAYLVMAEKAGDSKRSCSPASMKVIISLKANTEAATMLHPSNSINLMPSMVPNEVAWNAKSPEVCRSGAMTSLPLRYASRPESSILC